MRGLEALHPSPPQSTPTRSLHKTSTTASSPRGHPSHHPTPSCPKVRPSDATPLRWSDFAPGFVDQVLMRTMNQRVGGQAARGASVSARVVIRVSHRQYRRAQVWRVHQGLGRTRISRHSVARMRRCRRPTGQSLRRRRRFNVPSQSCLRRRQGSRGRMGQRLGWLTGRHQGWQKERGNLSENENEIGNSIGNDSEKECGNGRESGRESGRVKMSEVGSSLLGPVSLPRALRETSPRSLPYLPLRFYLGCPWVNSGQDQPLRRQTLPRRRITTSIRTAT